MEQLLKRRSIRKYKNEAVSNKLLYKLLEEATRTQTMGNMQLYSVIITRSKEMKEKLSPCHFDQPMVKDAPVVLTICADFNRTIDWCKYRNAKPGYDNFVSFLNAATDALLFSQTVCQLSENKGLGICFIGTTIYNSKNIIKILKLPKLVFPVATITLGWPDEDPELSDRLPLEAIIHEETYKDYTEEDINHNYIPKEALAENKKFVELNKKETLAQVYTDIRYSKDVNEEISKQLITSLKEQGYLK